MVSALAIPVIPDPKIYSLFILCGFALPLIFLSENERSIPQEPASPALSFLLVIFHLYGSCCISRPFEQNAQICEHFLHAGMLSLALFYTASLMHTGFRRLTRTGQLAYYHKNGILNAADLRLLKLYLYGGHEITVLGILMWDARMHGQMQRYYHLSHLRTCMQHKVWWAGQRLRDKKCLPYQKMSLCRELEEILDKDIRNFL